MSMAPIQRLCSSSLSQENKKTPGAVRLEEIRHILSSHQDPGLSSGIVFCLSMVEGCCFSLYNPFSRTLFTKNTGVRSFPEVKRSLVAKTSSHLRYESVPSLRHGIPIRGPENVKFFSGLEGLLCRTIIVDSSAGAERHRDGGSYEFIFDRRAVRGGFCMRPGLLYVPAGRDSGLASRQGEGSRADAIS